MHLVKCSNLLLKYVTRDDFKEKIMTALQRVLLRNPEVILETVDNVLNDLNVDLSEFSADLIKLLGSM